MAKVWKPKVRPDDAFVVEMNAQMDDFSKRVQAMSDRMRELSRAVNQTKAAGGASFGLVVPPSEEEIAATIESIRRAGA